MSGFILHNNRILQSNSIDYEVIDDFPVYEVQPGLSYSRPSDWVSLPSVSEGDQVIHMLVAVYENVPNWLGFTVVATSPSGAGSYSVSWGDGAITGAAASNTTSKYNINWSGVSSGTLSSRGYRQAIVTISATQGSSLTSFDLRVSPSDNVYFSTVAGPSSSFNNDVLNSVLDIRMAGISFSSVLIGDNYKDNSNPYVSSSYANMLEQFEFVGTNSVTNFANMFRSLKSLKKVKQLYTGLGTTMSQMFYNCNNLVELPERLDTRNVTNMYAMFGQCTNINRIPGMTTSNVTNMEQMFIRCYNLDIAPYFDTGNVTNMRYMFSHCHVLDKFEGWNFLSYPIVSVWYDTKNVTNMDGMFWRCHKLQTIPQFNTTNVATMSYMFYQNSSLQSIPGLTTSNVKTMRGMFYQCRSLVNDTRMTGVPYMDTGNVTDMKEMFFQCYRVKTIPQFNTQKVLDMSLMFYDCISLQQVPLLNTATCSSMYEMFALCQRLESIPQFNTSNVMTMARMFWDCYNLREIPLLDTSNVINMTQMFYQTANRGRLKTIPLLNTSNVRSMYQMFYNNRSLQNIPELNTSNLRTVYQMFTYCINLKEIKMVGLTALGVGVGSTMDSFMTGTGSNALPINASRGGNVTNFWTVVNTYYGPPAANNLSAGAVETAISPYYAYEPNFGYNYVPKPQTNTYYGGANQAYPVPNNGSIDNYFVPSATDFTSLFDSCLSLRKVEINAPAVQYATSMFQDCTNLRKGISLTFSSSLIRTISMFKRCYNLKEAPMFETSGVLDMSSMFYQCYELVSVPTYSTPNVTNMTYMFYNLDAASNVRGSIREIPMLNTQNVTNMSYMFAGCRNLATIPNFNTVKLSNADYMFYACINFKTIPLLNLPALTTMKFAFQYCYSIEYVPAIFTYSTVSVNSQQAFQLCSSLRYLESPFNSKLTNLYGTFADCVLLEKIPQIDVTACADFRYAFRGCVNLVELPGLTMSAISVGSYPSLYGDGYHFTYNFNSGAKKLGKADVKNFNFHMMFNGLSFTYQKIKEIFANSGTAYGGMQNMVAHSFYGAGNSNGGSSRVIDIRRNPGTAQLTYRDRKVAYDKWWTLPGYGYIYSRQSVYNNDGGAWTHPIVSQTQDEASSNRPYGMFWRFVNNDASYSVYKNVLNTGNTGDYITWHYPEPANTDKDSIDNGAPSNNILDFYNTRTYDYWMWRISGTTSQAAQANYLAAGMHALTQSVYEVGNQHKYDLTTYVNQINTQPTIAFATASYRTLGAIYDLKIGKNWFRQSKSTGPNTSPISNVWFKFSSTQSGTVSFSVLAGPSSSNVVYGTQQRSQLAIWESDGITECASAGWSYSVRNPFALSGVPTYSVDHMPATASCAVTASNWYYISVDVADDLYQGTFTLATWWI